MLINHLGQFQSATISFNLKRGASLSHAVEQIKEAAAKIDPRSVTMTFQGIVAEFQNSLQGLWALLAVAIFVIYIVLGILYESFIHPLNHSVRTAFSWLGCSAYLAFIWHGPQYIWLSRTHHAHWYRQEKCHYDD